MKPRSTLLNFAALILLLTPIAAHAELRSNQTRRQEQVSYRKQKTLRAVRSGYNGTIAFSDEEKAEHLSKIGTVMSGAKACVDKSLKDEEDGYIYNKYGLFPYFGKETAYNKTRSEDGRMEYLVKVLLERDLVSTKLDQSEDTDNITPEIRVLMQPKLMAIRRYAQALMQAARAQNTIELDDVTKPISEELHKMYKITDDTELLELVEGPNALKNETCIGFAIHCLEEGFIAAGEQENWNRIKYFTETLNDGEGTALIEGLRALGWKVLYWNADTSLNGQWDSAEKKIYGGRNADPGRFRGYHGLIWNQIQTAAAKGEVPRYYINPIDDWTTLVDFKKSPPKVFTDIPFFIGVAHLGHHVFAGSDGNLVEAHWDFNPEDAHVVRNEEIFPIEARRFNPLDKVNPYLSDDYDEGPPLLPHMVQKANSDAGTTGGPRGPFYSGLIVVPPGSVPDGPGIK